MFLFTGRCSAAVVCLVMSASRCSSGSPQTLTHPPAQVRKVVPALLGGSLFIDLEGFYSSYSESSCSAVVAQPLLPELWNVNPEP